MSFWDTSAILPLLVEEPKSGIIQGLRAEAGGMCVWTLTPVEIQSALARRVREGRLNSPQRREALLQLAKLEEHWSEIPLTERIRQRARRLVQVQPLRAADALQLSSAMELAGDNVGDETFVSLDARLRDAAESQGFRILPG